MHFYKPTSDFVTSTLNGAMSNSVTSATIGTGLNIPATNGLLQIDYDSTTAVLSDNGPETISYTAYNTLTGALTGITRGLNNTGTGGNGVAHANGATVQCGMSTSYFQNVNYYSALVTTSNIAIGSNNTMVDGASLSVTASGRPFLVGFTAHVTNNVASTCLIGGQLVCDSVAIPATGDGPFEAANPGVSFNDHNTLSFTTIWTPSGTGAKTVKFQCKGRNNAANFTGSILTGSNIWAIEL